MATISPEAGELKPDKPQPMLVHLDLSGSGYVPLLGGPPQTVTMRSGLVVLQPAETVGTHTTGCYEETLVVLEGMGEFRVSDGTTLTLTAPCLAYCPPATEHNVVNTGVGPLRYIYLVAKAYVK